MREHEVARVSEVKSRHEEELLKKANVVAVGVGFREQSGRLTEQLCIVVSVRRKIKLAELDVKDVIPVDIEGVKVDVRETGEIHALGR